MPKITLQGLFPDPASLLALEPQELGKPLLQIAKQARQNGIFYPNDEVALQESLEPLPESYRQRKKDIGLAIMEGWSWLKSQGLIVAAPGSNAHTFAAVSRTGEAIQNAADFDSHIAAAEFPKGMLHPIVAEKVWLTLARGDLADAVFTAFRTVEERVRSAGGYGPTDIGPPLMRLAFHKDNGPLTDKTQPEAERESLAHLFAGAMGSYKNPHSHRTVTISDPREAQEMVLLASHLLRIVDARDPNK